MIWHAAQTYGCDPRAPGQARKFCAEQIAAALPSTPDAAAVMSDAAVIASELVTNAVRAGCTSVRLTVDVDVDIVRLDVHDDAPGRPVPRRPGLRDRRGRGLLISAALADDWRVDEDATGKGVWAQLRLAGAH
jgi:anti-sigma regulatory factor (Ser/Thr protein kinase)